MDVFVMTTSNTFMKNKITFDCKKWCKSNRLIGSTLCSEGCWLLLGKSDNRGISALSFKAAIKNSEYYCGYKLTTVSLRNAIKTQRDG